ncbi:MAG: hypothetical protein K0T01_2749, partial [Acidimicrobiia bacterium]|nr:hypothetical protein [Acidimicrobiia bacterium]
RKRFTQLFDMIYRRLANAVVTRKK